MPPKHSEEFKEMARQRAFRRWEKWHAENPDHAERKKKLQRAADVRYATKHFGSEAAKRYEYKHHEPIANKQARIEAQGGQCANRACRKPIDIVTGHQDHNHETGEKRGVLCAQCNQALGLLYDTVVIIDGLSEYRKIFP